MAVQTQIQTRRGTAASWTSTNPTLAAGEIGFETDTGKFKIGNGSTAWAALAYSAGATAVTYLFNATSGQTTFSGADANGLTLAYTVGAEQVYLNGVLQVRGSDYTATNGTSIVLASGALTSDVLNVIAYSAMTITDTYTQAQADAKFVQVLNTPNPSNPFLNSAMQLWQRGTSFAVSGSASYTADRWQAISAAYTAGLTVSRQATNDTTNLPNIQYCARVQRDSGNTSTAQRNLQQCFESVNSIPFAGKTVTLSFYARKGADFSAAGSNLVIQWAQGTGTDENLYLNGYTGGTNLTGAVANATLTTTWQRFSYTATVATNTKEIALNLYFNGVGTAGTNDYFEVTGVQMEVGSIATPFRTYGGTIAGELAACQRYYWRNSGAVYNPMGPMGYSTAATTANGYMILPVSMRVTPTSIDFANMTWRQINGNGYTVTALTVSATSTNKVVRVDVTCSGGGMTSNIWGLLETDGYNNGVFGLSAEL